MFRRDVGRFSRLLGIFYIAAQYGGAFFGSQMSYNLFLTDGRFIPSQSPDGNGVLPIYTGSGGDKGDIKLVVQGMIFETLGSLLLTFLYLTQTEEKTKLSGDPAITTMIISATYTSLMAYSMYSGVVTGTPFNPAIGLSEFFAVTFGGQWRSGGWMPIYMTFGYAGSLLAVLLFEFVYKKAMDAVEEVEQIASDDDEEDKLIAQNNM